MRSVSSRSAAIARHAAYAANLVLLLVLVRGEITTDDLFATDGDTVDRWRRLAQLWRSQLPVEGFNFMCDRTEDTVMHALEPVAGNLDATVGTFHTIAPTQAISPMHALLALPVAWLANAAQQIRVAGQRSPAVLELASDVLEELFRHVPSAD